MKKYALFLLALLMLVSCSGNVTYKMEKSELMDKIKGGWAGQTIGCTYGGPTEFRYCGTMIPDDVVIKHEPGCIKWWYENVPGLYDDVYMDLTFVDVFDRYGLDAPVEKFADAFAGAGYPLWHANQAARYNLLAGISPEASGHWMNNPHADDIDFQIEADYAGLMAPGMVNAAVKYTDEIGHIMNYGDGWYGGVYVAAMYSLAFIHDDVNTIVTEALKVIPQESRFHKCMSDVIRWYGEFPEDWKRTWTEYDKKWNSDLWCPDGVDAPFNIDATINSAYVLIGLLYGQGDFARTIDIATRCGQDSDCNPATAAGILGTMKGYSNLPAEWLADVDAVEDMDFAYTDISLNKVYQMSYEQALQVIGLNGGKVGEDYVEILSHIPETVRLEVSFPDHHPAEKRTLNTSLDTPFELDFKGKGLVVSYYMNSKDASYVAEVEVILDGEVVEVAELPADFRTRKHELFWKYAMSEKDHNVRFTWLNPRPDIEFTLTHAILYSSSESL